MKLETFFKHFDLLAEAPNGVQKLRELILDLAVRGKLVPQDANDEPAAVSLERIKKEKERLVKEGKIKKEKSLPAIKDDEIPYNLPIGWEWVRFGNLVQVINGRAYKQSELLDTGTPVLRVGNLFTSNKWYYSDLSLGEDKYIDKGDLIYAWSASFNPFIWDGEKVIYHYHIWKLKFFTEGFPKKEYLYNYLLEATNRIKSSGSGIAMIHITKERMEKFIVPIPPLAEQKRIVSKVDELMKLCDELEARQKKKRETRILINNAALNKLLTADTPETFTKNWQCIGDNFDILYSAPENIGKLRQAILQLAVMGKLVPQNTNDEPAAVLLERIKKEKERLVKEGKIKKEKFLPAIKDDEIPFELPIGWEWVRVIDIVDIGTGSTPATTNPEYYGGNIPWYTSSATNNYIAEKPQVFITEKALKETNCKIFPSGSLIIALYGQGKTRGQISEIMIAGATNQAIAAMVFFESSKELKKYIKYYFLKIYDEIRNLAEGGAQPNLNVGKIKNTLIPIPPFNEQKRIVTKVDKLMKLCDELETKLTQTQTESEKIINAAVKQLLTV
jgi:type I restriction enzyme S subunit